MKAILIREHGGLDKLTMSEVPDPEPRAGEAVVRVRAVALNHLDIWLRRGVPGHTFPLPMIPGSEVAGGVEEVDAARGEGGAEGIVPPRSPCGLSGARPSPRSPPLPPVGLFCGTGRGGPRG